MRKAICNIRIILTTVILLGSSSSCPNSSSCTTKCNQVAAASVNNKESGTSNTKSLSDNAVAPTALKSYEPWLFNVFADWHGAESFVIKPPTASTTSELPSSPSMAWDGALKVLQHIKQEYGGEVTLLVGDTNNGKWNSLEFQTKFTKHLKERWEELDDREEYATQEDWNTFVDNLSDTDIIDIAGRNCYSAIKHIFNQVGYDNLLVCIGDHELGGT
jgi:hypothetical protein